MGASGEVQGQSPCSAAPAMTKLRPAERILLAYFAYTLAVSLILGGFAWRVALVAGAVGVVIWILAAISPHPPSHAVLRRTRLVRDWLPLALVPVAYWQMDFVRRPESA